jgi:hypothetical protein
VSLLDYPDFRALALMLFREGQLKEVRLVEGNSLIYVWPFFSIPSLRQFNGLPVG